MELPQHWRDLAVHWLHVCRMNCGIARKTKPVSILLRSKAMGGFPIKWQICSGLSSSQTCSRPNRWALQLVGRAVTTVGWTATILGLVEVSKRICYWIRGFTVNFRVLQFSFVSLFCLSSCNQSLHLNSDIVDFLLLFWAKKLKKLNVLNSNLDKFSFLRQCLPSSVKWSPS